MSLSQTPFSRRLPNKTSNLQGAYRPRMKYIDPRLMLKVTRRDISSNKGSRCRGRGAWYNSIGTGLRLGEISLQSITTTLDVQTPLFTELLNLHHRCCSPEDSHQTLLPFPDLTAPS